MRRGAYEEPAYVAGGPPESSYQPSNFNHDQYEAYYDTLKKKGSKKVGKVYFYWKRGFREASAVKTSGNSTKRGSTDGPI